VKENKLAELSMEFSVDIINLVKHLKSNHDSVISNQIGRSGTSIGANIHEAQYAQGKKDFVSKLEIALKEASETGYWLELFTALADTSLTIVRFKFIRPNKKYFFVSHRKKHPNGRFFHFFKVSSFPRYTTNLQKRNSKTKLESMVRARMIKSLMPAFSANVPSQVERGVNTK